jgi:hypothetical protein
VTRSIRDIDDDKSRLFTETLQVLPKQLVPVQGLNSESVKPLFQDISPSGLLALSLRQGGKSDEIPLIHLNGADRSHYLDASDYHGKFVGDSWFGGVSWSHDERCVRPRDPLSQSCIRDKEIALESCVIVEIAVVS